MPAPTLVRRSATLASGAAIGVLAAAVSAPLLARAYAPTELGRGAVALAIANLGAATAARNYDSALASCPDGALADRLASHAFATALRSATCWTVALLVLGWFPLPAIGHVPAITDVLIGATILATATQLIGRGHCLALDRFPKVSTAAATVATVRAIAQVAFGLAGLGAAGLIAGELVGRCAGTIVQANLRSLLPGHRDRAVATRYREVATVGLVSTALNQLTTAAPTFFVSGWFGDSAAGQFALATRVLSAPSSVVSSSVGDALQRHYGEIGPRRPAELHHLLRRSVLLVAALSAVPCLIASVMSPPMFRILLGEQWSPAGRITAVVAIGLIAQLAVGPATRVLFVLPHGQRVRVLYDVSWLALLSGAFVIGRLSHLSLVATMVALTAANVLSYLVYYAATAALCRRWTALERSAANASHPHPLAEVAP